MGVRAVLAFLIAVLLSLPANATVGTVTSSTTIEGNGSATSFTYNFDIPNQNPAPVQVSVLNTTVSPNVTTVISPSQYTITGLGNASGGTVLYPVSGSPLATGYYITITRNLPLVQTTSVCNQGPTFCAVEHALDYLTMLVQQLQTEINVLVAGQIPATLNGTGFFAQFPLGSYEYVFGPVADTAIGASPGAATGTLRANTLPWPTIHVPGYYAAGDGGGGDFEYVSTDTTSADNSCTIIVDAAEHRYYRQTSGTLYPKQCGASGNDSTNDTTALTDAIAVCVGNAGVLDGEGLTYLVTAGFTLDIAHCQMRNFTLDASSFTTQTALTLTPGTLPGGDVNLLQQIAQAHPLSNVVVLGPTASNTSTCIAIVHSTYGTTAAANGVTLDQGGCAGFNVGLTVDQGGYLIHLHNFAFGGAEGRVLGTCFETATSANLENVSVDGMECYNFSTKGILVQAPGDYYFDHSSIDGSGAGRFIDDEGGATLSFCCHLESLGASNDTDYMIYGAGNALVLVHDGDIAVDAARVYPVGYSAVAAGASSVAGISFSNVFFTSSSYAFDTLIAGPGQATAQNVAFAAGGNKPAFSLAGNVLYDGTFASTDEPGYSWLSSGSGTATRVTTNGPGSADKEISGTSTSYELAVSGNDVIPISGKFPCKPGQMLGAVGWVQTSGIASNSGTLTYGLIGYYGQGTASPMFFGATQTADSASWSQFTVSGIVPPGVVSCAMRLDLSTPSGVADAWFSNIFITPE